MSGNQWTGVLVLAILLWAATSVFGHYTDAQAKIRLAELRAAEQKALSEYLTVATAGNAAIYQRLIALLGPAQ